jgi:imidazolonepropionase-like amidohydrolase
MVVRAGVDTVEHGWYLTEENCRTLIAHKVHLVPTASNIGSIARRGPALNMPWAGMVAEEEPEIMDRFRMAIDMGVKIAAGTDIGGNESHPHLGENAREIEVYVQCGMPELAAIGSTTLEAARAINRDKQIGSIESGKKADLVVIDQDPLSDISRVRTDVVAVIQSAIVRRDDLGLFDPVRAALKSNNQSNRS